MTRNALKIVIRIQATLKPAIRIIEPKCRKKTLVSNWVCTVQFIREHFIRLVNKINSCSGFTFQETERHKMYQENRANLKTKFKVADNYWLFLPGPRFKVRSSNTVFIAQLVSNCDIHCTLTRSLNAPGFHARQFIRLLRMCIALKRGHVALLFIRCLLQQRNCNSTSFCFANCAFCCLKCLRFAEFIILIVLTM